MILVDFFENERILPPELHQYRFKKWIDSSSDFLMLIYAF